MEDTNKPIGNFTPTELDKDDVGTDDPTNFLTTQIQMLPDPSAFIDALEKETAKQAQSGDVVQAIGKVFGVVRKILLPI